MRSDQDKLNFLVPVQRKKNLSEVEYINIRMILKIL